jgi:hypothetical protein
MIVLDRPAEAQGAGTATADWSIKRSPSNLSVDGVSAASSPVVEGDRSLQPWRLRTPASPEGNLSMDVAATFGEGLSMHPVGIKVIPVPEESEGEAVP